jgi:hypothetical protein
MNELSNNEKRELAVFFKRLSFNLVLETTDGGADNRQAYRILDAIAKLQKELADQGYNPR